MDSNISNMVLIKYWPTHRVIYSMFSQNGIFILSPQKGLIREVMRSHLQFYILSLAFLNQQDTSKLVQCIFQISIKRDINKLMSKKMGKIKVYSEIVGMKARIIGSGGNI